MKLSPTKINPGRIHIVNWEMLRRQLQEDLFGSPGQFADWADSLEGRTQTLGIYRMRTKGK
jgi:hypothetical protein